MTTKVCLTQYNKARQLSQDLLGYNKYLKTESFHLDFVFNIEVNSIFVCG